MRGPIAPVCQTGTRCSTPPRLERIVFIKHSAMVAEGVIERDGSYSVSLPAGTYSVDFVEYVRSRTADRTAESFTPRTVQVVADRTRRADFSIDSGIR